MFSMDHRPGTAGAPPATLTIMTVDDWHDWHDAYDDPESWQAQRSIAVRDQIRGVLETAPPGPLTVLALVAGQGRDPQPVVAGTKLFTFVGIRALRPWEFLESV